MRSRRRHSCTSQLDSHGRLLERWYPPQSCQYHRVFPFLGDQYLHSSLTFIHILLWKGDIHYSSALGVPYLVQVSYTQQSSPSNNSHEGLSFTSFFSVLSYISSSLRAKSQSSTASLGDSRSLPFSMPFTSTSGLLVIIPLVNTLFLFLFIFSMSGGSLRLCYLCQLRSYGSPIFPSPNFPH